MEAPIRSQPYTRGCINLPELIEVDKLGGMGMRDVAEACSRFNL